MSVDRRKFFKIAGLTALGLAGGSAFEVFAQGVDPVDSLPIAPEATTPAGPLVVYRARRVHEVHRCLPCHAQCAEIR